MIFAVWTVVSVINLALALLVVDALYPASPRQLVLICT